MIINLQEDDEAYLAVVGSGILRDECLGVFALEVQYSDLYLISLGENSGTHNVSYLGEVFNLTFCTAKGRTAFALSKSGWSPLDKKLLAKKDTSFQVVPIDNQFGLRLEVIEKV